MSDAVPPSDPASPAAGEPTTAGMPADAWVGRQVGKYQLTRRLGQGGMGVVYEALDTVLRRPVALKLLSEALAADPDAWKGVLREARAVARLNHPQVVAVYEADQRDGACYLALELVPGG